jgi:hypothetical protein
MANDDTGVPKTQLRRCQGGGEIALLLCFRFRFKPVIFRGNGYSLVPYRVTAIFVGDKTNIEIALFGEVRSQQSW